MDLWIRSQDKESLTKVSNIQYTFHNDLHVIGTYYDNLKALGKYKSKERALVVLDDIQDRMLKSAFAKKINGLGEELDLIPNNLLIYKMPKE